MRCSIVAQGMLTRIAGSPHPMSHGAWKLQAVPTSITRRTALWVTTLAGCSVQAASEVVLAAEEVGSMVD